VILQGSPRSLAGRASPCGTRKGSSALSPIAGHVWRHRSGPAEAGGRWPPDYAGGRRKNRSTCIDVAEKAGTLAKLRRSWRPGPRLPRGGTGVLFGNRISGRGSFRSACGPGETSNVDINHTGLAGRDRFVMHAGLGGRGASAPRRDLSSVVCGADRSRPEQTSSVWKAA
jgi:hypothetical protein